jgi:polysaccharide export outer membrane protein
MAMGNLSNWIVLWLILATGLGAQTKESLKVGPGDMLHVQVYDSPDLDQHTRVTDTGELPLLMGGSVTVTGLTLRETGHAIEEALQNGHFLLNPRVLVTFDDSAALRVSVLGEVHLPGAYPIPTPRSILDVLSLAGGLTDLADRTLVIERHDTSEKVSYFVSNVPGAALDTAVKVNPGDTVIVPRAGIVYALGDVMRPGGYTMTNNEAQISVLELVARAGGTPANAVPAHTRLIRKKDQGYVEIAIPLSDMQKGKLADIPLMAGDILYVPFSYLRNFALTGSGIAAAAASAAVYRF